MTIEHLQQLLTSSTSGYHNTDNNILLSNILKYINELVQAKQEAQSLALHLWKEHYKDSSPVFELCDSVPGVLSQIDNMCSGLISAKPVKKRKFKIFHSEQHSDPNKAGKKFKPNKNQMIIMNSDGIFFLYTHCTYPYIMKLSELIGNYDVIWK